MQISFTGKFYTSARVKLDHWYELKGLNNKEQQLAKDFNSRTAQKDGYKLIASGFDKFDNDEMKFTLIKGKKRIQAIHDFTDMNGDRLIEIFNLMKTKIKKIRA